MQCYSPSCVHRGSMWLFLIVVVECSRRNLVQSWAPWATAKQHHRLPCFVVPFGASRRQPAAPPSHFPSWVRFLSQKELEDADAAAIVASYGRVPDVATWLDWGERSLQYVTQGSRSMAAFFGAGNLEPLTMCTSRQYVILAHDTKEEPVFNFGNQAALEQYEYTSAELLQLPSRYSAPEGAVRNDRRVRLKEMTIPDDDKTAPSSSSAGDNDEDGVPNWGFFPFRKAIRQTQQCRSFEIDEVWLWNVYDWSSSDPDTVTEPPPRLGQMAIFDRECVTWLDAED